MHNENPSIQPGPGTELRVFLTAVMFYSRLPVPHWVDHSSEYLNKATRYFPLVGLVVGAITGAVFFATQWVLPLPISLLLSMAASLWVTGAFHEDGWADVCDGFGGGYTKAQVLRIMKDSVLGAYGVIGIVLMLLLKFMLLWELAKLVPAAWMVLVLVAAYGMSRLAAVAMMATMEYARDNEDSKAKPVAKKQSYGQLAIAAIWGVTPILFFNKPLLLIILIPILLIKSWLGSYFKKKIDGYTGDCLGATQQVSEIVFYISFFIIWKYI